MGKRRAVKILKNNSTTSSSTETRRRSEDFAGMVEWLKKMGEKAATQKMQVDELRKSSAGLTPQQKAERLLRLILEDWESCSDLEALVYLASRGLPHKKETKDTIEMWAAAEERVIGACERGHTSIPTPEGDPEWSGGRSRHDAADILNRTSYELHSFWDSRNDPRPTEATMFRVVEWCGIDGFDAWWTRFARETNEDMLQGGPVPEMVTWWLFDMCRSSFARKLMGETLLHVLNVVTVCGPPRRFPWVLTRPRRGKGGSIEYFSDDNLDYAASLVWCAKWLRPSEHKELTREAVGLLAKHQLACGGWSDWTSSREASIETTAVAIHAIATSGAPRSKEMMRSAAKWLIEQQDPAGYWAEASCPNRVYLTVLVLDALEMASGGNRTTLRGYKHRSTSKRARSLRSLHPSKPRPTGKRFRVALSFPGELRPKVGRVAKHLAATLGKKRVFYDKNFQHELARPNLDTYLQSIYATHTDLVVLCASPAYATKKWCGIEWRAIRNLVNNRLRDDQVMIVKLGSFSIKGIYDYDGYIDGRNLTGKQIAEVILERIESITTKHTRR
jgi:hypothetical protein